MICDGWSISRLARSSGGKRWMSCLRSLAFRRQKRSKRMQAAIARKVAAVRFPAPRARSRLVISRLPRTAVC
jgi:hypothetical protein